MKLQYLLILVLTISLVSQLGAIPNCYIYKEDEDCYEACREVERAVQHRQGSNASQVHFLKSMELCPELAYAYFEHAVPFAKNGLMHEWIGLMNKAVALNAEEHLGWRGWYHWFFMHNYEKAIKDIDSPKTIIDYDIGATGDGFYHLSVMQGLCYKGLGQYQKAIDVIEECMTSEYYDQGAYDYLHLGVLYLELGKAEEALDLFQQQMDYNDLSEAYYYSAKAYHLLEDQQTAVEYLETSLEKYDAGLAMSNPYRQLVDEIYRLDIQDALIEVSY